MTNNYNEELGTVKADLQILKNDIAKLSKSVATDAQENAAALSAKAKSKVISASERTKEASLKGKSKAQKTVTANPLTSIAATAGIGLVVGALIARR